MDLKHQGKRLLITGASRGIGKAIAFQLLKEGAKVLLVARGREQLRLTVGELAREFGKELAVGFPADCTDEAALQEVRKQVEKVCGRLDGVVANVGDGRSVPEPIPEPEQWSKIWQSNFGTALNTARVFLPMLRESQGSLLFISSITGLEALGAPIDYSTAKTAVIAFAQNMARKVAPEVRVNVIAPGNVHFPGSSWDEKVQKDSNAVERMLRTAVPMKRFGTPEEIADAAAFLVSSRASFITGAVLRVDGGQVASLL